MKRQLIVGVRKGEPIQFPGGVATPRAFAVALRLGAFAQVWNTPVGMEIVHANGVREQVRIVDVTRWALVGLGLLAMVTGVRVARH